MLGIGSLLPRVPDGSVFAATSGPECALQGPWPRSWGDRGRICPGGAGAVAPAENTHSCTCARMRTGPRRSLAAVTAGGVRCPVLNGERWVHACKKEGGLVWDQDLQTGRKGRNQGTTPVCPPPF